jgi:hypothetical protein
LTGVASEIAIADAAAHVKSACATS